MQQVTNGQIQIYFIMQQNRDTAASILLTYKSFQDDGNGK